MDKLVQLSTRICQIDDEIDLANARLRIALKAIRAEKLQLLYEREQIWRGNRGLEADPNFRAVVHNELIL